MDMYIVQFKERLDDWNTVAEVTTITVPGNITTLMLTGLIPSTSYDVRVATSNSLGESAFSFEINFITARKSTCVARFVIQTDMYIYIQ